MSEHKHTVLLVDDERHVRLYLKALFRDLEGVTFLDASTGREAVEAYAASSPDLVLLDISMPYRTGEQVLRDLIELDPEARVIMLTSISDTQSIRDCLDAGALNYIRKDTPGDVIVKTIADFLETD